MARSSSSFPGIPSATSSLPRLVLLAMFPSRHLLAAQCRIPLCNTQPYTGTRLLSATTTTLSHATMRHHSLTRHHTPVWYTLSHTPPASNTHLHTINVTHRHTSLPLRQHICLSHTCLSHIPVVHYTPILYIPLLTTTYTPTQHCTQHRQIATQHPTHSSN